MASVPKDDLPDNFVPKDDLPDNLVPEDDLPSAASAAKRYNVDKFGIPTSPADSGPDRGPTPPKEEPKRSVLGKVKEYFTQGGPLRTMSDLPEATFRSLAQAGNAVGQLALAPLEMATGKPSVFSQNAKGQQQAMEKLDPTAQVIGNVAATAAPGMGIARAAAPVVQGATAAGPMARIAATAGLGGATNAALTPATGDKPLLAEKGEQFTMGTALGAGAGAVGEGLKAVKPAVAKAVFGSQGDTAKALWDRAKTLGFDLSPSAASDTAAKVRSSGITASQKDANAKASARLVTEATGRKADSVPPDIGGKDGFLSERFKTLGKEYDDVYKPGTSVKVDPTAVQDLSAVLQDQNKRVYSMLTKKAKEAADRITERYDAVKASAGVGKNIKMNVPAEDIQLLRNELAATRRNASDPIDKRDLSDVITAIDGSVERNHPELAAKLAELNPKYRATVSLSKLRQYGGIDANGNVSLEKLGTMLRSRGEERNHPLSEAAQLGEVFGIRGKGETSTVAGVGHNVAGVEDAATKAGMYRLGVQYAERFPPVRKLHEQHLKGNLKPGLTEDEITDLARWAGQAQMRDSRENQLPPKK